MKRAALTLLILISAAACRRAEPPPPQPDPTPDPPPAACTSDRTAPRELRRLTSEEYDAAVSALLGTTAHPGRSFPPEEGLGFSTAAEGQSSSVTLSSAQLDAAEQLATAASLTTLLPCAVDDACAPRFISSFGRRAFRRELTADEAARLLAFFETTRATEDVETSYRLLLQVFLQAPQFLYAVESRAPGPLPGDQLATRLALFLWAAPPDDALLDVAASGGLDTKEGVEAAARRMLADPRARDGVRRFHLEWLGVSRLSSSSKSDAFPDFEALKPSMLEEAGRFGEWATLEDGRASQLFSARTTFLDGPLAALYGFTGLEGPELRKVDLSLKQRGGVLTQPAVLSAWAKADQSSPVQRGKLVRERFLCETLPRPPGNVVVKLAPPTFGTTRERYSQHASDPACAGCHRLMDPVGFGFEHYDAIGAYRNAENGRPIDSSGELIGTKDLDGKFDGALDLGARLATSSAAKSCLARQWFRYALGRAETDADACSFEAIDAKFGGGDLRELLVAIAASDAFRSAAPEGGSP